MADTLTTTTQVDPAVSTFYDRVLLKAATQANVHLRFAQHAMMPKKSGNTYKWRRYTNLSVATTPMVEGADPPGQRLAKTDLMAQVAWYGDYVHITDVIDLTVEDPVLTVAADKQGTQMRDTFDTLMRDILSATASATNASGGSNGNTPTEITRADVDAVVLTMLGNNAKMIEKVQSASTGIGTAPTRAAFWAIIITSLLDDLEDCTGFKPSSEYPNQTGVQEDEWGSVGNTRWLQTTNAKATTDSPVQYHIPVIGQDAYGDVTLLGKHDGAGNMAAELIVKPFDSGGVANPLNRQATSGWKAVWVARILNDSFIHVLEVTSSA